MRSCVVVTGAGTGIGRAVTRLLAETGHLVVGVGRRPGPLDAVAAELGDRVIPVSADLAAPSGARALAERLQEEDLDASGVVTCAGGLSPSTDDTLSLEEHRDRWRQCFDSNVLTSVLTVEALRPSLMRGRGRVVLLSSVAALRGSGGGPYGAMKSALHAWMYDLAGQLGPSGGTANVVAPGFVPDTEFWNDRRSDELIEERSAKTLVKRPGTPEEIASLIAWLLGPDGGWVTGQILSPNGGAVLGR